MATYPVDNKGKIARLYPTDHDKMCFMLKESDIPNPPGTYYFFSTSHPNYQALLSLLYMAAESRYVIGVRSKPDLVGPAKLAEVRYLYVNW